MKNKIIKLLIILMFILVPFAINAKEKQINVYLFHGDGCPHCATAQEFLDVYLKENKNVKLYEYEVWYSKTNAQKYRDVQKTIGVSVSGLPFIIVGEKHMVGFGSSSSKELESMINYYEKNDYYDPAGEFLGVKSKDALDGKSENKNNNEEAIKKFDVPILGEIDAKNISLGLVAVVIGLVDGFNPCALWILFLLITLLFGMKDRKRMWTLGITFLVSSAFVYMFFMLSWLNLASFLNSILIIRILIALFAIIFGSINIKKYFKQKVDGCEVVDTNRRKKLITKMKKIIETKTFWASMIGIIALAVSVNIIELMCSLGLPVMFTQILSLNDLSYSKYLIYVMIYILFFMIDDIIVFVIAMKTLEIKAISNKYTKYSHLIGGLIMLLIGLLMILKPEWLMLNF